MINSPQDFWITRRYLEILDSGLFFVNVEVLAPEDGQEITHSWNVEPSRYRKDLEKFFRTRKYRGTKVELDRTAQWTGRFTHIPRELWFDTPHITIVGRKQNPLCSISVYELREGSTLVACKAVTSTAICRLSTALDHVAKLDYEKFVIVDASPFETSWHPDGTRVYDLSDEVIMMLKLQI